MNCLQEALNILQIASEMDENEKSGPTQVTKLSDITKRGHY